MSDLFIHTVKFSFDTGTELGRVSSAKSDLLRVIVSILEREDVHYSLPTMKRRGQSAARATERSVEDDAAVVALAALAAQVADIENSGLDEIENTQVGEVEAAQSAATAGLIAFANI